VADAASHLLDANLSRAMRADNFVRNRSTRHWDRDHVAARAVNCLPDRFRHFVRFAGREADASLPISNRYERVEGKAASTLHDFRYAVDRDHVLDQLAATVSASAFAVATLAFATSAGAAALTAALTARATLTAAGTASAAGARTAPSAATATAASTTTTATTGAAARAWTL